MDYQPLFSIELEPGDLVMFEINPVGWRKSSLPEIAKGMYLGYEGTHGHVAIMCLEDMGTGKITHARMGDRAVVIQRLKDCKG